MTTVPSHPAPRVPPAPAGARVSPALLVVVDALAGDADPGRHPGVALASAIGGDRTLVDVTAHPDSPHGDRTALREASTVPTGGLVHVYAAARGVRDRPEAVAALVEQLAERWRVTITLRGLPESRGDDGFLASARACHRMARAADAVAVTSAYERRLAVRVAGVSPTSTAVIPLAPAETSRPTSFPVPCGDDRASTAALRVGIIGPVTGTSGHLEVLDACARLVPRRDRRHHAGVTLVTLATGDSDDRALEALRARADVLGVGLDDAPDVHDDIDVPVVPGGTPGSGLAICTWATAGRRPLVSRHAYALEVAHLRPGHVRIVDDGEGWSTAIVQAADGDGTRLPDDLVDPYALADAALDYRRWWQRCTGPHA